MGFFDRAKAALGLGGGAASGAGRKGERPALRDLPAASPAASIDDALTAREAGHPDEARAILRAIDRGKGLRTVLRAAAALEARDEEELAPLVAAIAASEPGWRLALQIAGALGLGEGAPSEATLRTTLSDFARTHGAPAWALGWTAATTGGDDRSPAAMVELLFADAALARTVAAREWKIPGAADDPAGIERYATFSHGRDGIRRFGARAVGGVFARAFEPGMSIAEAP